MVKQIIFHVGFPKTGTTSLQAKIFPRLESINYLGKDPQITPNFPDSHKHFFEKLIHYSDVEFANNLSRLQTSAIELFKLEEDGTKLFSHEGFIRNTYMSREKRKYQDINRTLSRLKEIFHNLKDYQLKLMVTIRKQEDLLPSYFAEFYRDEQAVNGQHGFKQFLDLHLNKNSAHSFPDSLKYFQLYQHLTSILPAENILMIPCEGLFSSDPQVISLLTNFLAIEDPSPFKTMQSQHLNARSDSSQQWLKKRYRRVHKYNQILGKLISRPTLLPLQSITHVTLSQQEKKEIHSIYAVENQKLNEITGDLLNPFDYC